MVYSFDFIILISFSNVTLSIDMGHFKVLYVIHLFDIKWHFHCWLENLKKKKFCIKIFIFKLFGSCMCKMWIKQAFTFSFKKLIMWFPCINLQVKWLPCIYFQTAWLPCIILQIVLWLPRFSLQLQDFHAWIDYFAWFDMLKFSKLLYTFSKNFSLVTNLMECQVTWKQSFNNLSFEWSWNVY